jgi:hypothetical protein
MLRIISITLLILMSLPASAETSVLRSLPSAVQKKTGEIRNNCPGDEKNTSGDEGLQTFTVSGAQAVLVDELNFCGGQLTCLHGINCATGYSHQVEIYIRRGNVWTKSFSVQATEPILLIVDWGAASPSENPKFRALVLSVHGGDDMGCPIWATFPR